jgi:hypothetical protein
LVLLGFAAWGYFHFSSRMRQGVDPHTAAPHPALHKP